MDLGAANRKASGDVLCRLCRRGTVIRAQGIGVNLYLKEMVILL